jgi:DNA-binding MarR family transcriptional regulator
MLKLHGTTLEILTMLCSYHPDRLHRFRIHELASDCEVNRDTAASHLRALQATGHIQLERRGRRIKRLSITPKGVSKGINRVG